MSEKRTSENKRLNALYPAFVLWSAYLITFKAGMSKNGRYGGILAIVYGAGIVCTTRGSIPKSIRRTIENSFFVCIGLFTSFAYWHYIICIFRAGKIPALMREGIIPRPLGRNKLSKIFMR